jgi:hypothetical protein
MGGACIYRSVVVIWLAEGLVWEEARNGVSRCSAVEVSSPGCALCSEGFLLLANLRNDPPPSHRHNQNLDIAPYIGAQCAEPGPVPPVIDAQGLVWVSCLGSSLVTRTALFNMTNGQRGPQCSVNIQ